MGGSAELHVEARRHRAQAGAANAKKLGRRLSGGWNEKNLKPTLSALAAALIAVFEGPEKLAAYRDTGGIWTIGRGHTHGVTEGMTITHEQAVAFFAEDQAPLLGVVSGRPLFAAAAYTSFGFNCGMGALHAVLAGVDKISNPKHCTDRHGTVLPGLVSRRALEELLVEASA